MAKCPSCGCLNKKPGKCELCGGDTGTEEKVKPKYTIPKRNEKGKKTHDEDIAFYKEIWKERPHKSEVSGQPLGDEFNVCFFSHILAKGAFPRFRHYKKNILLKTFDEHHEWETCDRKHPKWNKVRDLMEELLLEYYKIKL
jgi:hypothetical protein